MGAAPKAGAAQLLPGGLTCAASAQASPLSSSPLLPARPLIWMYSPEESHLQVASNVEACAAIGTRKANSFEASTSSKAYA